MSRPPPSPKFVHYGIVGGASCSYINGNEMFIGTMEGIVMAYDLETNLKSKDVYDDEETRKIQSIDMSADDLIVQIRGFAIIFLRRPIPPDRAWRCLRIIETTHIGFCNSVKFNETLFFASNDASRSPFLCWTQADPYDHDGVKNMKINALPDVTPMHLAVDQTNGDVLVGMEDGGVARCAKNGDEWVEKEILKFGKEPVFCVAVCSKYLAVGHPKTPISLKTDKEIREIHYPQTSSGCSSLIFSPNEKQLLAGFWDGSIRVFSCNKLHILLSLSHTHSSTITSLQWTIMDKTNEDLVVATSTDGKVSLWNLK